MRRETTRFFPEVALRESAGDCGASGISPPGGDSPLPQSSRGAVGSLIRMPALLDRKMGLRMAGDAENSPWRAALSVRYRTQARLGAQRTSQSTELDLLFVPPEGPDEELNEGGGVNWMPGLLGSTTGGWMKLGV